MSTSFASQGRRGRIEEALERFREAQRRERLEAGGYDTIQTMSAEARALQRRKFASDAEARRHLADLRGRLGREAGCCNQRQVILDRDPTQGDNVGHQLQAAAVDAAAVAAEPFQTAAVAGALV